MFCSLLQQSLAQIVLYHNKRKGIMKKTEEDIEASNVKLINDYCVHKPEVLAIGNLRESLSIKEPFNFNQNFKLRLQQLILNSPSLQKRKKKQFIATKKIQVNPQTRHYEFCMQEYVEPNDSMRGYNSWLPTINAHLILRNMKVKLKKENWISENVVEKKAQEKDFWKYENNIYDAYSHAVCEQDKRIVNFVVYLHEQYRKDRGSLQI